MEPPDPERDAPTPADIEAGCPVTGRDLRRSPAALRAWLWRGRQDYHEVFLRAHGAGCDCLHDPTSPRRGSPEVEAFLAQEYWYLRGLEL